MIRFYGDHYFQIGSMHYTGGKPCQDYALSAYNDDFVVAIVADGCSKGRHTDVGSRILALSTIEAIIDHTSTHGYDLSQALPSINARQEQNVQAAKFTLGLSLQDLLSTCVYTFLTKKGGLIYVQGDGVFAIKRLDGSIEMHKFDWAENAPYYPAYGDAEAIRYVEKLHGGNAETAVFTHTSFTRDMLGADARFQEELIPFDLGKQGFLVKLSEKVLSEIEYIAVFTDGLNQIGRLPKGDEFMPWVDMLVNFMSFKSTAGEFAKRRMIRGIKDLNKLGFGPIDDIACSVARIVQTEE